MSYRPITDVWILTRARLKGGRKRYGCYLGGFPERARVLIGADINDPVLHVCGGLVRLYPHSRAFGPNDRTLDLDPSTEPDYLADARKPLPEPGHWRAILMDPPYSEEDAAEYPSGAGAYPEPSLLVRNAIDAVGTGRRVGISSTASDPPLLRMPNASLASESPAARETGCVVFRCSRNWRRSV